jgi:hypothetical protein
MKFLNWNLTIKRRFFRTENLIFERMSVNFSKNFNIF